MQPSFFQRQAVSESHITEPATSEVIRTYVPQGVENDSYVNWKILITDLKVIFKCINEWKISYEKLEDKVACKQSI